MNKIGSCLQGQTSCSPYLAVGVGLAVVALSYLVTRCLTGPKNDEHTPRALSGNQQEKAFVICPKTGSREHVAFAARIAEVIRKAFPKNASIILRGADDASQLGIDNEVGKPFLSKIIVGYHPIIFSCNSFEEAKSTYVFHDSVFDRQDFYPFEEDHIIDIGSTSRSPDPVMKKKGIYCLKEDNLPERFEHPILRNYDTSSVQKALYEELAEGTSEWQNWDPLLFLTQAAVSAQEKKLFHFYVPGGKLLSQEIFPVFLEELLKQIEQHPKKPSKVEVFVPGSLDNALQEVVSETSKGGVGRIGDFDRRLNLSCATFSLGGSSRGSSTDKTMRLFFLGDISEQDRQKLHWGVQNQIRNKTFESLDMSFSEWLSCKTEDLNYLIQTAEDYELLRVKKFLEDYRRDVLRVTSPELCQEFAEAWMDKALQQEAQKLREILEKEFSSSQLVEQKLGEII